LRTYSTVTITTEKLQHIATQAARWGANQELEACCEWLAKYRKPLLGDDLRYVRRPKPPTPEEQALAVLPEIPDSSDGPVVSEGRERGINPSAPAQAGES